MGSMDESRSKRRKLSPTSSIAVNASIPLNWNDSQVSPTRSSFLSPTKASLARFNPTLLPRPKPAGRAMQSRDSLNGYPFNQGVRSDRSTKGLNPTALRSTPPPRTPEKVQLRVRASTVSPRTPRMALNGGPHAVFKGDWLTNGEVVSRRRSQGNSVGGSLSAPPVRDVIEAEEQIQNTATLQEGEVVSRRRSNDISVGGNLPASPVRDINEAEEQTQNAATVQLEPELHTATTQHLPGPPSPTMIAGNHRALSMEWEPELPPTPTQLGLEETPEPPKGLLYISPLRRAAQKRSSKMKSSPLKQKDIYPNSTATALAANERSKPVQEDMSAKNRGAVVDDLEELRKYQTLNQLSLQLKALQEDVSRIESGIGNSGEQCQEQLDELLALVLSTNPTHKPEGFVKQSMPISTCLSLFLPFSKRAKLRPAPAEVAPIPMPSHTPIQLEDPLRYLSAFTPFAVTSIGSIVPSSSSNSPLLHYRRITLVSPGDLLIINLHLSVNCATQAVDSLSIISVSTWADQELGTWARENAAIGNISVIGWACGRYWEVGSIRARCWFRCYREFRDLLHNNIEDHHMGEELATQNGGLEPNASSAGGDGELEQTGDHGHAKLVISRTSLLKHLGRQSLHFTRSGVSLLISWVIGFDWAGEVESFVSASTSFPRSWRNVDERASLDNVGDVFDRVVREMGVFAAVKVLVGLLFSS